MTADADLPDDPDADDAPSGPLLPGAGAPSTTGSGAPLGPDAAAARNARLRSVAGPRESSAAVLALLLTPRSRRERAVWRELCADVPHADDLRRDLRTLQATEHLPWLEHMIGRLAGQPLGVRQALLQGARRLMAADGRIGSADRLRWLLMRHLLGERQGLGAPGAGEPDLAALDPASVQAVGLWTAFLSRLVPMPEIDVDIAMAPEAEPTAGALWWQAVMAEWPDQPQVYHRRVDADMTAVALSGVQALPWMLRPVLVRRWFDLALHHAPEGMAVHPSAAEALRISARLLDCPLPPPLAACFVEVDAG